MIFIQPNYSHVAVQLTFISILRLQTTDDKNHMIPSLSFIIHIIHMPKYSKTEQIIIFKKIEKYIQMRKAPTCGAISEQIGAFSRWK